MSEPTTNEVLKSNASTKIGVIISSQRTPRVGPQISQFVLTALKKHQTAHPSPKPYELVLIDLADHPLPLFDEPGIPSQIHSPEEYSHAHTRAWSEFVSTFSAFVFVTPQYNWGYPAGLKNAIDYLYNEWKGKPAIVVSYGGHGGGKAADQLKQVLHGLDMKVVDRSVALAFPDRAHLVKAATGKDLELDKGKGIWVTEREEIGEVFGELLKLLHE